MYIRQTKTSTSAGGEAYYTYRLVASERIDGKVRQKTLLNLGRNFSLPREPWPQLCARIASILAGQMTLANPSDNIEKLAQRYAAQLVAAPQPGDQEEQVAYAEVDVASLELVRPRSIGVEYVGLEVLSWLGLLKGCDINDSWTSLRKIFSGQQRVTATFKQKDGRTLHIRKTTVAEPKLKNLYDVLGITSSPVGLRKMVN